MAAESNLARILSALEVVETKDYASCGSYVIVEHDVYITVDFGITSNEDTNMCFYLCVENGDKRMADVLKDLLLYRVPDKKQVGTSAMAEYQVVYTYVYEYEVPICIVDTELHVVQYITPKKMEEPEERLYLIRTAGNHYLKLIKTDLDPERILQEMRVTPEVFS